MSAPWSVIVPQGNTELVAKFEELAAAMGLVEILVETMLYLEFSNKPEPPEPLHWWEAKPLPFKVKAKIPCDLLNKDTTGHRLLTDGRIMDVWSRLQLTTFGPDEWGLQVLVSPSLWVRPQDCEPL